MLLMLCVCSHQVLNLFTLCSLWHFSQKLVPINFPLYSSQKNVPKSHPKIILNKNIFHCFCPNLRRVNEQELFFFVTKTTQYYYYYYYQQQQQQQQFSSIIFGYDWQIGVVACMLNLGSLSHPQNKKIIVSLSVYLSVTSASSLMSQQTNLPPQKRRGKKHTLSTLRTLFLLFLMHKLNPILSSAHAPPPPPPPLPLPPKNHTNTTPFATPPSAAF